MFGQPIVQMHDAVARATEPVIGDDANRDVVARGKATAKKAGAVKLTLKPTKKAKRAAKRMKGVTLTVTVSQGATSGATTLKVR